MHDSTTKTRNMQPTLGARVAVVLWGLLTMALAGCTADDELTINLENEPDLLSISRPALERMNLEPGTHVVVPTDSTIMGLDANVLAGFAAEDGADALLDLFVLAEPFDPRTIDGWIAIPTTNGNDITFERTEDGVAVGVGTLIDVREENGVTLIVVEGLWDE